MQTSNGYCSWVCLNTANHCKSDRKSAMGKMRNCGVRNAVGKMRNGMCGAMVIGRDVTSRDRSYSAFRRTQCVDSVEVNCILSMWKIAFSTVHATFRCWFLDIADKC